MKKKFVLGRVKVKGLFLVPGEETAEKKYEAMALLILRMEKKKLNGSCLSTVCQLPIKADAKKSFCTSFFPIFIFFLLFLIKEK